MENAFVFQVLDKISEQELDKFTQFLNSEYFNQRTDVVKLLHWWQQHRLRQDFPTAKKAAFEAVYPGQPYDADRMNLCMRYLLDRLEHFLAYTEWHADRYQYRLSLMRALRRRDARAHFERQARRLEQEQRTRSERHAGYYWLEYQLQNEVFEYKIMSQRNWQGNLPDIVAALGHFFALENLRWSGMTAALNARSGAALPEPPFAAQVQQWANDPGRPVSLQAQGFAAQIMSQPDDEPAFEALCTLLPDCARLFPASQCRDLYMTAINFCIRRQNRGDRSFTRRALDLYRQALDLDILLENGAMPRYTYHNINALAHLAGESEWAAQFLEQARPLLPAEVQEATYRYNVAIGYFRKKDYARTMELLKDIDTSEVFVQLDIRRMLVRAYYETGEWLALDSLLSSFRAYLIRQKGLGYHQESYLNFIKYTKKVVKVRFQSRAKRTTLRAEIEQLNQVAEKEWLMGLV